MNTADNPTLKDPKYLTTRNAYIAEKEGFRHTPYLDVLGIPTIGAGLALVTRNTKTDKPNQFVAHPENFVAVARIVQKESPEYQALSALAERHAVLISGTPNPTYAENQKKTPSAFMATERGKKNYRSGGRDQFSMGNAQ